MNCVLDKNKEIFPFGNLEDEDLPQFLEFESPSPLVSLPVYEITLHPTSLPNLSDYDIDEQMPQTIDFRYFKLPELSSLQCSSLDLSILHTNIRSLYSYHDELIALSCQLSFNPDVIGFSEIWDTDNNPITTNEKILNL